MPPLLTCTVCCKNDLGAVGSCTFTCECLHLHSVVGMKLQIFHVHMKLSCCRCCLEKNPVGFEEMDIVANNSTVCFVFAHRRPINFEAGKCSAYQWHVQWGAWWDFKQMTNWLTALKTIAVITVEPAVQRFSRESEAFGSSFWRECVYVSSILTFWLFCRTSDLFYQWWGIAQPMDTPTEVISRDGRTYRGISIAFVICEGRHH